MLGANIGCDVVRKTMFAGPRPDIPLLATAPSSPARAFDDDVGSAGLYKAYAFNGWVTFVELLW